MKVPLLNFVGGPGVSLLNFKGVPGPTFKLLGGSRVPGSWSHFYTMSKLLKGITENLTIYFTSIFQKVQNDKYILPF